MNSHLLIKPLLIFLGGAVFSVVAVQIITHINEWTGNGVKESGRVIGKQIESKVSDTREGAEKTIIDSIKDKKDKIFPAIIESPALAPIFRTTKEVEGTINNIKGLPEEQRNAVCRQICGE